MDGYSVVKSAILGVGVCLFGLTGSQSSAQSTGDEQGPFVVREGAFVCVSPAAYAEAIKRAESMTSRRKLGKELTAERKCYLVDEDDIEDMYPPFTIVTDTDGDMIKIRYDVEYYKRIHYLHREFGIITFSGWTHVDQLMPRADLAPQ